jgi:hypothetical protein
VTSVNKLSITVMTHPRRAEPARRLAGMTGAGLVVDPDPDGPPSALRTAAVAWSRCPEGSTHHMVLQDDVSPSARLWPAVERALARDPEQILALYQNLASWNGARARVAVLAGYSWLVPTLQDYFPTLAVVMPCAAAHLFAKHAEAFDPVRERDDDQVLARFLSQGGYRTAMSIPALVEHQELPSLSGYDHVGIRRSVCFQGETALPEQDRVLDALPAWPMFVARQSMLKAPSRLGRERWQVMTRSAHLRLVGVKWRQVRDATGDMMSTVDLVERRSKSRRFLNETWLAGHTLGWTLARIGAGSVVRDGVRDDAVKTYLEAGLCYQGPVDLWQRNFPFLLDFTWGAIEHGLRAG